MRRHAVPRASLVAAPSRCSWSRVTVAPARPARPRRSAARVGPGVHDLAEVRRQEGDVAAAAGSYRITVRDRADIHNFHLRGPGVNKRITGVDFAGTEVGDAAAQEGHVSLPVRPALAATCTGASRSAAGADGPVRPAATT